MNQNLLAILRHHYGTVSSLTETSGVIAVRNVTTRKNVVAIAERYNATVSDVTANLDAKRYPRLIRVTEVS